MTQFLFMCVYVYLHRCIYVYSNKSSYGRTFFHHFSVMLSGIRVKDNKERTLTFLFIQSCTNWIFQWFSKLLYSLFMKYALPVLYDPIKKQQEKKTKTWEYKYH